MAKTFPYLEVEGTNYNLGYKIGSFFRKQIQARLEVRRQLTKEYTLALSQIEPYKEETKRAFPKLVEELEGYAKGADVPLEDCFLANTRELFDYLVIEWEKRRSPEHCTIAVSLGNDGSVVGHNEEDWLPEVIDDLYVLRARVDGVEFLGLNYFTELPGNSAALNSFGLVQCINTLYSETQVGVPRNFLARAVLECRTLDEADELIRKTKRASGFNHVLVQSGRIRNIETSSETIGVQKIEEHSYAHTNHFLSSEMKALEKNTNEGSRRRLKRAKELVGPGIGREGIIALLRDTNDAEFPICNAGETIGSVVILPEKEEVWICYGHPCAGEFVKYTL